MDQESSIQLKHSQKSSKRKKKSTKSTTKSSISVSQDNSSNNNNNSLALMETDINSNSNMYNNNNNNNSNFNNSQQQQQQNSIINQQYQPNQMQQSLNQQQQQQQQQQFEDIYSDEYCENQMKFIELYIKKWRDNYIETMKANIEFHLEEHQAFNEQLNDLKSERVFLNNYKESNLRMIESQQMQLQLVKNEIKSIEKNRDQLPLDLEFRKIKYDEESTKLSNLSDTIKSVEESTYKQLNDISIPLTQFKKYLGLDFKKLENNEGLKFIFTHIDQSNHFKEFSISISIDKNTDDYIMIECNPMVPNINQLINYLNLTNNLSNFIKRVRKSFVNLTTSTKNSISNKQINK